SLEDKRMEIENLDSERDFLPRSLVYRLSKTFENSLKYIMQKEEIKQSIAGIKKEIDYSEEQAHNVDAGLAIKEELEDELDMPLPLKIEEQRANTFDYGEDPIRKQSVKNEIKFKLSKSSGRLTCTICNKTFVSKSNIKYHMRLHSDAEEERCPYQCNECGKRFSQIGTFKRHAKIHLPDDHPDKNKFGCEICGKTFSQKGALQNHSETHLEKEKRSLPHQCPQCDMKFAQACALKAHMIVHLAPDDPQRNKIECEVCGKLIAASSVFRHKLTHFDSNDPRREKFKCDICGKTFTEFNSVVKHEQTHMTDDDPRKKKFKCDECGKICTTQRSLNLHSLRHKPEGDPLKEKYKCDVCGKCIVGNPSQLARHKETHLDSNDPEQARLMRPFECTECDKYLRTAADLKVHMTLHTGRYPYKCERCGKGYNKKSRMKKHFENACRSRERKHNFALKVKKEEIIE
ncbi:hypothetical protein PRIPAC_73610, partial [Pristionchus pacificus]